LPFFGFVSSRSCFSPEMFLNDVGRAALRGWRGTPADYVICDTNGRAQGVVSAFLGGALAVNGGP
jgi:hypothetical protein